MIRRTQLRGFPALQTRPSVRVRSCRSCARQYLHANPPICRLTLYQLISTITRKLNVCSVFCAVRKRRVCSNLLPPVGVGAMAILRSPRSGPAPFLQSPVLSTPQLADVSNDCSEMFAFIHEYRRLSPTQREAVMAFARTLRHPVARPQAAETDQRAPASRPAHHRRPRSTRAEALP